MDERKNYSVARVVCHTNSSIGKFERHIEQKNLNKQISDLSIEIELDEKKSIDTTTFINKFKRYTEITELTPDILNEFIQKIMIHQCQRIDGKKYQQIDIYYNGVGIIQVPLDEIEMEQAFQEHIKTA